MELAAAQHAVQEPGGRYGDLQPLARQALQPRVSRTETAVTLNALAGGRPGAAADSTRVDGAAVAARAEDSALRERRGDKPLQENPSYRPADLRGRPPAAAALPGGTPSEGFDGKELRNAQAELRALRADVAELARAMGRPLTSQSTLTEYRGVLQQFDELDSDVQRMRFDNDRELAANPRPALAAEARQGEARQLVRKQEQLLSALRRAERQLDEAPPQVLPPGIREAVIGEILRARYSAPSFGGISGGVQFTGQLANAVV